MIEASAAKKIIPILSVAIVLLVAAVITLGVLLGSKSEKIVVKDDTCTTKACIDAASLILTNIDETKNPCLDFNQFACGGFFKTKILPDDSTSIDSFTDLRNRLAYDLSEALGVQPTDNEPTAIRNAKNYYRSCMDEATIETNGVDQMLHVLIQELGGAPMFDPNFDLQAEDPIDKLLKYQRRGLKPLFDIYVSSNPKDPHAYVLRLQQVSWFLSKESYDNEVFMTAYKTLIKTLVSNLSPVKDFSDADLEGMFDLERTLVRSSLNTAERRNQTYQNFTIRQLEEEFPNFPWVTYIVNRIFQVDYPNVGVTPDESILVVDIRYLKDFTTFFQDATTNRRKDLYNLLMWYMIKGRTNFLPKLFRNAQLEFDKIYSGATSIAPRTRTCSNAINDRMPYAVGRLYVESHFSEESKKDMEIMIENIRKEFKLMLDENEWMDKESKDKAREKADYIDSKVAYPDFTYNDTYLNILYQEYQFSLSDYLSNSLRVTEADFKKDMRDLREARDTKQWLSGPAVVNAFYSSTNNQITFPAGILQQPFFHVNSPKYLNYGGVGVVIGHEITHGFDDQGRKYDKDGVFFRDDEVGLWTNQTIQNYLGKAQCIVDQYSNYTAKQVNMNVRGFQTQGENIADNGGMKESFRAFKRWEKENGQEKLLPGLKYNQDQLFFINYAQIWCLKITDAALKNRIETGVHSPGEFRIVGPTSNSYDFERAFNCPKNTYNNPDKKCAVW